MQILFHRQHIRMINSLKGIFRKLVIFQIHTSFAVKCHISIDSLKFALMFRVQQMFTQPELTTVSESRKTLKGREAHAKLANKNNVTNVYNALLETIAPRRFIK